LNPYTLLLQAVQKLIDEEFEGIVHLRTSSFQKRVSTARHDFIKLSGAENKLEALLQVMETLISPSLLCTYICLSIHSSLELDSCIKNKNWLYISAFSTYCHIFVSVM
jgi:hypothetical protein